MQRLVALVVALFAFASTAQAQRLVSERVPMRDGVELATDVWLPVDASAPPRAVVLRRTPYGRAYDAGAVAGFIAAGYALVSQDVRGRGDSAGEFLPFFDDAHDGFDTIAWAAAQPWSNGRVGTIGGSAEGIVQLLAMGEGPPALECAQVTVATDDVYEGLWPGGAWRTELTSAWLEGLGAGTVEPVWRAHEVRDAYWDPVRLTPVERARSNAAVLLVGGVYDIFSAGTVRTFAALQGESGAGADQFMVLGPWTHGGAAVTRQGSIDYVLDATYRDYLPDLVAFFDWCLGSGARPTFAPVRYFVSRIDDSGAFAIGEWRDADTWPPASTATTIYLHDDGALRASAPSAAGASTMLPVDPAHPLASVGGGNLTTPAGPFDQRTVDAMPGVVVATLGTSDADADVVGNATARIWASSDSSDTDVIVRLEDLTPDGHAMLVADGVRRGRFVAGYDAIGALTPSAPTLFEVDLGPVSLTLSPGHTLRVAIAGTSSPRYEPNPGVATPLSENPTGRATTLTLYRDAAHPSAIVLPVARGALVDGTGAPRPDAGVVAMDAGTPSGPASDGGCGCTVARQRAPFGALAASTLALLVLARRRRRRRLARRVYAR